MAWTVRLVACVVAGVLVFDGEVSAGPAPKVKASSVLEGKKRYAAENVLDGDPATAWAEGAKDSGVGESLAFTFSSAQPVAYIGVVPGYSKYNDSVGEVWFQNNRVKKATLVFDGKDKQAIELGDYRLMQYFPVNRKVKTIKLVIDEVYRGTKWDDTCISEVAFIEQARPELGISGGPEFKTWPAGQEKMGVALRVLAPFVVPSKRKPVHVAMVIDVSGSMTGEPMRSARESAKLAVSALQDGDYVALVSFSGRANIDVPAAALSEKTRAGLLEKIDSIGTVDDTNLSDGFVKGVDELVRLKDLENSGRYVFFFTDGAANAGVTDPGQLASLTRDLAKKSGARFSTFGMGKDFQDDLLRIIASESRGNYFFIKNPREMLSHFGAEVGRISQATARDVTLELVPPDGAKVQNVRGGFLEGAAIKVGDLRAGESRLVLLDLKGRPAQKSELLVRARFHDPSTLAASAREAKFPLVPADGPATPDSAVAPDLAVHRAQTSLAESAADISVNRQSFIKKIQDRIADLEKDNKALKSPFIEQEIKYLKELEKDMAGSTVDGEILIKGVKYKIQMIERAE